MSTKNISLVFALCASMMAALVASSASAQIPAACQVGTTRRLYDLGLRKGKSLANQAWGSTDIAGDCDNVDRFRDVIIALVNAQTSTLGSAPSDRSLCQLSGVLQGLLDRAGEVQDICIGECFLDGEFAGEFAAILYCALSISTGGLGFDDDFIPRPVGICGSTFEQACEDKFEHDTTLDLLCLPFTQNPFDGVWEQTQTNQCMYDPEPV